MPNILNVSLWNINIVYSRQSLIGLWEKVYAEHLNMAVVCLLNITLI